MSLYGGLAEAFRRNERVDRGIGAVTGSLAVTTGVDVIQSVWLAPEKATAPEADILSWSASNNVLTIYAWKIAVSVPTITVTNSLAAAGAVTTTANFTLGSSTVAAQYTGPAATAYVEGGTVTAASVSRDGTTYYAVNTNNGATGFQFHVEANDYIKITYSGTPTVSFMPNALANSTATSSTPAASLGASSTALNVSWGVVGTSYSQHPYPGA